MATGSKAGCAGWGGQFAGILRVEVAGERREELIASLQTLEVDGLRVIIHADAGGAGAAAPGSFAVIDLVGQDRPGILRSISAVFAAHGANVEELACERVSAPMGGGTLFQARGTVFVPASVKVAAIRADLERIAADLMVELEARPQFADGSFRVTGFGKFSGPGEGFSGG